jgi:glycosyltransferase involved in cell wall biosynthesis
MEGLFNSVVTHLSVVLPVLNESSLIDELISQIKKQVELITSDYEIIFVDDGSEDITWKIIKNQSLVDLRIKGIKLSKNFGHHFAITAGINRAQGDWVVVMDSDLQDKPENILKLYKKALEGHEVVFVSRKNRPEKIYYLIAQKLYYLTLNLISGIKFDSSQANFSIISKNVVNAFNSFPENARFYGSTIMWLGFKRASIDADHGKRHSGTTSYSVKKRIKLAFDVIFSFSERPLKLSILVGMIFSTSSLTYGIWLFWNSILKNYSVEGWSSIMISIYFVAGVILMVLGILGIYLGRIFREVKRRPLYVVEELANYDTN